MIAIKRAFFLFFIVSIIGCLTLFVPAVASAQDTTEPAVSDTETTDTTSETATEETREVNWNEAQTMKADNVAEAAAEVLAAKAAEAQADLAAAEAELTAAEANLADLNASSDASAAEIAAAEAAVAAATAAVTDAQATSDAATAASDSFDVSSVTAMRESGMGWGEICHELGIHPSVLGLALGKKKMAGAIETIRSALRETKNAGKKSTDGSDVAKANGNADKDKSGIGNSGDKGNSGTGKDGNGGGKGGKE